MRLYRRLFFYSLFLVMAMPLVASAHTGTDYTFGGTFFVCTSCHTGNGDVSAPQIDLSSIAHPYGMATPMQVLFILGNTPEAVSAACITCHQSRPETGAMTLDNVSCVKCHGPATLVSTTGSITSGTSLLTVVNPRGLMVNEPISVSGAGDSGGTTPLNTSVTAISGYNITLSDLSQFTVTFTDVTQSYPAVAGQRTIVGTAGSVDINVDPGILTVVSAKGLLIGQMISIAGAGNFGTPFNTYIAGISGNNITLLEPSSFSITSTDVTQMYGGATAMTPDQMVAYAMNMHALSGPAPTVATVAGVQISGYTVTFSDASTPANASITVNWHDGTVSAGKAGDLFTHTYPTAATYSIVHTASSNNKFASEIVDVQVPSVTGPVGTTSGTIAVQVNDYQTPVGVGVAGVSLYLKQNGLTRQLGTTDSTGQFTFTNVPAGTYDVVTYQYGEIFGKDGTGSPLATPGVQTVTIDSSNLSPVVTFTQTQTRFTLTVTTATTEGTPAPTTLVPITDGAAVMLTQNGVTRGILKTTDVGGNGQAVFENLPNGTYRVEVLMPGYTCTALDSVDVSAVTGVTVDCTQP